MWLFPLTLLLDTVLLNPKTVIPESLANTSFCEITFDAEGGDENGSNTSMPTTCSNRMLLSSRAFDELSNLMPLPVPLPCEMTRLTRTSQEPRILTTSTNPLILPGP